jgi:hypothetical protein
LQHLSEIQYQQDPAIAQQSRARDPGRPGQQTLEGLQDRLYALTGTINA